MDRGSSLILGHELVGEPAVGVASQRRNKHQSSSLHDFCHRIDEQRLVLDVLNDLVSRGGAREGYTSRANTMSYFFPVLANWSMVLTLLSGARVRAQYL